MTVKELIEALQKQPPDLEVRFLDKTDDHCFVVVTEVAAADGQWATDWKPYVVLT